MQEGKEHAPRMRTLVAKKSRRFTKKLFFIVSRMSARRGFGRVSSRLWLASQEGFSRRGTLEVRAQIPSYFSCLLEFSLYPHQTSGWFLYDPCV